MNRKRAAFALQIAVSAALLWLLFRDFDWTSLWTVLLAMPAWFYVLSFAAVLAGQLLYAYRWRLILDALGLRVAYRVVIEQYVVGIFFNNFLPSTIGGDWAKVYYLGRSEGYVRVGASVLVDRVLGLFLLATLSVVLLWLSGPRDPVLITARTVLTVLWATLAVGLALALAVGSWVRRRVARWPRLEVQVDSFRRLLEHVAQAARQPGVLAGSGAAVFTYFVILGAVYQQLIAMVTGGTPSLIAVTAAVTAIATLSNVPISVNGLGVREQLHLALLGGFGLGREAAAGMSLLLFGHLLLISAVGAVVWLRGPAAGSGTVARQVEMVES